MDIFCQQHRDFPLEEQDQIRDPVLWENLIIRVRAFTAWQQLLARGLSRSALINFHSRYKYQLMANNPEQYKVLGKLLGSMTYDDDPQVLGPRYFSQLMQALRRCATRGTHTNVLLHLSGYLRKSLSQDERQEMRQLISQYHAGTVPLKVPLTRLKQHLCRHPNAYLTHQVYLDPPSQNLNVRNAM
ncbi:MULTISPECIES: YbgA family protein [Pseudomonas]|jgi:uncharacterized protein YbgA (DUF1722 family)|uniref:YbgA family protein n=1 Tax=Pseudomonas TaxID=286 RepID=UPI0006983D38|nr:DUF1722 domain-containing protein [Pseudomonas sp. S11A 273]